MSYSFHPEAEEEFLGAIEYYEEHEEGLGVDFATEVRDAIGRAAEHPQAWPVIEGRGAEMPDDSIPIRGALFGRVGRYFHPGCDEPPP